jgi:DNA-binding response OmpR family regulator
MLISPEPDVLTSLAFPFPSESGNSADPFGNIGQHDYRADVLVIEDSIEMSDWLSGQLRASGFNAVTAFNGEEGLSVLNFRSFAIILLDWQLPGCTGIDVLQTLRARDDRTPVFLMSGFGAIEDRISGFENGADDYLVKPFAFPELLARLRARLRRAWNGENLQWRLGDLALHVESRRVYRAAQEIALTPREFDLLLYLVQHQTKIVSRETLGRDVWRVAHQSASLHNAIDVHIAHLRRKIDAEHDVKLIHTLRAKGYMISEIRPPEASRTSHPFSGCRDAPEAGET